MKFGVREICNVVFRAKAAQKIGNTQFTKGQPVLYINSAKTSTVEGAATTVYATGGRGNTRLIAWEGEKTLTFTVEDALLSPISFAMLSGAGLIKGGNDEKIHFHMSSYVQVDQNEIDLTDALGANDEICATAPIFIMLTESDGSLGGLMETRVKVDENNKKKLVPAGGETEFADAGKTVMVDYYVLKSSAKVSELQIDAENFAGYYYVEADTLFRRQDTGKDMPANLTLPNVKIQSNFTFSMASTGDPSTFTFTMDAMPGYTYFDQTKKVLCVIQIVDDANEVADNKKTVMGHNDNEDYFTEDDVPGGIPTDSGVDPTTGRPAMYRRATTYDNTKTYYKLEDGEYVTATIADEEEFNAGTFYVQVNW